MFSFKNARTSQKSRVFPFTCHLFFLLEALQGFVRLLVVWVGWLEKGLEGSAGFARFCEAMGSFERLWEVLGGCRVNVVCPSPGSWINHVTMEHQHFFVQMASQASWPSALAADSLEIRESVIETKCTKWKLSECKSVPPKMFVGL